MSPVPISLFILQVSPPPNLRLAFRIQVELQLSGLGRHRQNPAALRQGCNPSGAGDLRGVGAGFQSAHKGTGFFLPEPANAVHDDERFANRIGDVGAGSVIDLAREEQDRACFHLGRFGILQTELSITI